jgi:molybdopterin-binding protein
MIDAVGLSARAGDFALVDVSFHLNVGTWGIVLGPAGAGKTTLLETLLGARPLVAGRLSLRGTDVRAVPVERRGIGVVFQHGYLFPHLTVEQNVRYGATDVRGADDVAARFGADALRDRPVRSLSGGERQVVALARALASRPDILLLDEPFAALDPRRRTRVRRELHALQRERGITVLQVTHDFAEAGTLGDLAILMDGGRVVQSAPPEELFRRPATAAAAEFLGAENVYAGVATMIAEGEHDTLATLRFETPRGDLVLTAVGEYAGGSCHAVIRGEDVVLARVRLGPSSARNVLDGVVQEVATDGALSRVTVDVGGVPLVAAVTSGAVRELALSTGVAVVASVKATAVHLC